MAGGLDGSRLSMHHPLMHSPQAGVFALGTASHAYLEFDAAADRHAELVTAIASLREPRTTMGGVNLVAGFRPTLWRVTNAQVRAGSGTPQAIPVGPEIAYTTGFNLNGIVARGHKLIVVQSNTGKLFSIVVKKGGTTREIHEIASDPVVGGDGMLLDRGRLLVVRGSPAALLFLKLKDHASSAELVATQTDSSLRGPSTVARARHLYLVVNADFATSTTPFTVSGLPRGGKH